MTGTPLTRRDVFVTGAALVTAGTLTSRRVAAQTPSPVQIRFERGGLYVVPAAGNAMTVAYPKEANSGCCHVPAHQPVLSFVSSSVEATAAGSCTVVGEKIPLAGEFEIQNLNGTDLVLDKIGEAFGKRKHPQQPWNADDWAALRWVPILNGRLSPNAFHPNATAVAPTSGDLVASIKLLQGTVRGGLPLDPADTVLWRLKDRQHTPKKLDPRAITDTLVFTATAKSDTIVLKAPGCTVTLKSRTPGGPIVLTVAGGPPPAANDDNSFEPGGQLTHLCNFYRFLQNVPEPQQFVPTFAGAFWTKPTPELDPQAGGLPGRFCPGAMVVV